MPLLLCVHMDQARLMRFSFLASSLGIRIKEVKADQYGQTLEALCGLAEETRGRGGDAVTEEMIVMAFFPDDLIDRLLHQIRASGLGPIPCKAVLTPTNRYWTCGQLQKELRLEAAAIQAGKRNP